LGVRDRPSGLQEEKVADRQVRLFRWWRTGMQFKEGQAPPDQEEQRLVEGLDFRDRNSRVSRRGNWRDRYSGACRRAIDRRERHSRECRRSN
jgi:hypothetical protein